MARYGTAPNVDPPPRRVGLGLVLAAFLALSSFVGGPKALVALGRGQQLQATASCENCNACLKTDLQTGQTSCREDLGGDDCLSRSKEGVRAMEWCGAPAPQPPTPQPAAALAPFGVAVRGGGFRTMTEAMGFARAIGTNWSQVSHVGGTSGGTWFAAQLVYSKPFYESLALSDEPIEDVVVDWGAAFGASQEAEIKKGAYWTKGPEWDETLAKICKVPVGLIDTFFKDLALVGMPITPWWMAYVGAMMLPTIPDIGSSRVDNRTTEGLQTATLVSTIAVPPMAFLDNSDRNAVRHSDLDATVPDLSEAVIPAGFVVPAGGGEPGWAINPLLGEVTAGVNKAAPKPVFSENPFLLEVISGSSAYGGIVAVRSMMDAMIDNLKWLGPGQKLTMKKCVPFGLESLAPASVPEDIKKLSGETVEQAQEISKTSRFRFLDGGYVDDQGAATVLANMQQSCLGDCPTMKLLLISTDNYSTAPLFDGNPIPAGEIGYIGEYGGYLKAGQQIFAEPFPTAKWPGYATQMFPSKVSLLEQTVGGHQEIESTFWHGKVSTVDNQWYGTKSGDKVDLLMFHSNVPGIDVPLIVPAPLSTFLFTRIYGPVAKSQAAGAEPVISAWLDGTLPDTPTPNWP